MRREVWKPAVGRKTGEAGTPSNGRRNRPIRRFGNFHEAIAPASRFI
jgi:hypothetical protein